MVFGSSAKASLNMGSSSVYLGEDDDGNVYIPF